MQPRKWKRDPFFVALEVFEVKGVFREFYLTSQVTSAGHSETP